MKLLTLPLFLLGLFLKNVKSWVTTFTEAFGFQVVVMLLFFLNIVIGGFLFLTFQQDDQLSSSLKKAEDRVAEHRQFWQKMSIQVPGHKTVNEAQKTLTQLDTE